MTSLEDFWALIPEPSPGGEVGDGEWITQTLRKGLEEVEGTLTTSYQLADEVLASHTFLRDGRLAELPDDDAERWEYDLPAPLIDVPSGIHVGLVQRYGRTIRPLEVNLISSGAELVLRIMQKWLQQDGTPYPPPGYDADLRPIHSAPPARGSPQSQLLAAHCPINYL